MDTITRKRGRPPKKIQDLASSKSTLTDIKATLPINTEEKNNPQPGPAPLELEKPQATGSIAKVSCMAINLALIKNKLSELTEQEIRLLTDPINEIEVKYMPALMNKYADKASPFIQLAMAGYMIYDARKPKEPKIEPKKDEPTIVYCDCPAPEPLPDGKCAKCTKSIKA